MGNASYQELLKARQEGLEALGKGVSDCPYTKTGLQEMGQRDRQLANAWCAGLAESEAMERDADEDSPLAVTITLAGKLAAHCDVAAEAAKRVLPGFASVSAAASQEGGDQEDAQVVHLDTRDNIDALDAELIGNLKAAVVERLKLALLEEWQASFPLDSGGMRMD